MRTYLRLIPLSLVISLPLVLVPPALGQNPSPAAPPDVSLLRRALAAEMAAAQDTRHPMRYRLRKWSTRLATTKDIVETRDGAVAMLVAVNDRPLDEAQQAREQARLDALLADPGKQRHRKLAEAEDTVRALKVLRALPTAFVYRYAGQVASASGQLYRFTFTPNPEFDPPDLETQVLTALAGEIWIDPVNVRVVRLEGRLQQDVDFGWGILGRLNKGGWIALDQAGVGGGVWRVVRFQMDMSGRVFIRTRRFETIEEESQYAPVPPGLDYRQGIALLESH